MKITEEQAKALAFDQEAPKYDWCETIYITSQRQGSRQRTEARLAVFKRYIPALSGLSQEEYWGLEYEVPLEEIREGQGSFYVINGKVDLIPLKREEVIRVIYKEVV